MGKVLLIFDRLKQAFNLNVYNKKIYRPQIILAIINTIATLILLSILYLFYLRLESSGYNFGIFTIYDLFSGIAALMLIGITIGLVLVFFEAGLFQMYRNAVYSGETSREDFFQGAKRYFWKFFWVNILTTLMWIVFIPFYLILGIITIGAGFTLVPIMVNIFLSMWKVSIVSDECGIISAFKNSIKFAGKNFVPLMFFILLMMAFTAPIRQGGGDGLRAVQNFQNSRNENSNSPIIPEDNKLINPGQSNINSEQLNLNQSIDFNKDISNLMEQNALEEPKIDLQDSKIEIPNDAQFNNNLPPMIEDLFPNLTLMMSKLSGMIKIILISAISIITIGTLISSLIKMLFAVFFMLAMFVIYKEGFVIPTNESVEVVNE
ncbi:MAG: hypothetical protein ACM3UU_08805 [Ignavibacteriales bacterium]